MMLKPFLTLCAAALMLIAAPFANAQAQAPAGNVTIVTIIDVLSNANVPQNVENSNALLNKLAADAQKAPGNVSFKVLREASRANHFIIFAVWKDTKSFEDYRASETTRAFREAFQPKMGGPFDERVYTDLK